MKKLLLISLIFTFASLAAKAQGLWTQKASFPPGPRGYCVSFSIDKYGYAGLGYDGGYYHSDFWQYNPTNNIWIQKASLPGLIRTFTATFVIGKKVWVVTGFDSNLNSLNECWEYNSVTDKWTKKNNFPGPARGADVGFSIGCRGFLATGYDFSSLTVFDDVWEYDTANDTWAQKSNFAGGAARFGASTFAVGSNAYICFGSYCQCIPGAFYRDMWQYDTISDSWTQKAYFPPGIGIYCVNGFVIGNNIYLGTGQDSSGHTYNWFWKYNTLNDSWTQQLHFPGYRRGVCAAFSIGDTGYFGLGADSDEINYYDDFYKFYPDTLTIINELNIGNSGIRIFPNPFSTIAYLSFDGISDITGNNIALKCFDLLGREYNMDFKIINRHKIEIYRGNLANGTYVLQIQTQNKIFNSKLIINK